MSRTRWLASACIIALLLSACSDSDSAFTEESSLDSSIASPPVPKNRTATSPPASGTTGASGSSGTSGPSGPSVDTPVYWVSPDGDDGAAGTQDAPWGTLLYATSQLEPGDTLYLADGTFAETDGEDAWKIFDVNGTDDEWITIAAAPGAAPVVKGGEWTTIAIESSSYIEIRGLEVVGSATKDSEPTSGIEANDSHHLRFIGNYVHDGGGNGIGMINSNHIDIIDNYVSGMSKWNPFQTSGISLFASRNIGGGDDEDGYSMRVIGNTVYGSENIILPISGGDVVTDGNCIIVDTNDIEGYTGTTLVANNVCSNNGGRGLHVFGSSNVLLVNNTLYHNMQVEKLKNDGGELTAIEATNVTFRNNLVIPRDGRRALYTFKAEAEFENNLYQVTGKVKGMGDTDRIVSDAGVIGAQNGDFSLATGSPAINAGVSAGAPAVDVLGNVRDPNPDIGAREYVS